MADRRYLAQDITDSGQVEGLVRSLGGRDGLWAALFFSWLIPFMDDDGRLIGSPSALRSKVFRRYMDLVTVEEVTEALALMNDGDLIVWYEVRGAPGERYLWSPRFTRHQTLRADRYGPSRHPAPPNWVPDQDHPYGKNPELKKSKPPRDPRTTVRVAKRPAPADRRPGRPAQPEPTAPPEHDLEPIDTASSATSATTAQPADNHGADAMAPGGNEAPRHVTPRHVTTRHVTPPLTAAAGGLVSEGKRSAIAGLDDAVGRERRRILRLAAADDLADRGTRVASMVEAAGYNGTGTRIGRDDVISAYREALSDLSVNRGEQLTDEHGARFTPGMYADGRVRDRFGYVWASTSAMLTGVAERVEEMANGIAWPAEPAPSDPPILRDEGDE